MAEEIRKVSLTRRNGSSITPSDVPKFGAGPKGGTYEQQELANKAHELGDRQRWQGALAIHGEMVISRVQDHTMDTYEGSVDHNLQATERAKASGDPYRTSLVEEFTHLLNEETGTNLLNIYRGAARDIAATTHEMASYQVPEKPKGILKRILGR